MAFSYWVSNSQGCDAAIGILSVLPIGKVAGIGTTIERALAGESASGAKKVVIGLGIHEDLAFYRGTEAITHLDAGWQRAGLTRRDYARGVFDKWYFYDILMDASERADYILFNVKSFNPAFAKPGVTNMEFNYILRTPEIFQKTIFHMDGAEMNWTGEMFIPK